MEAKKITENAPVAADADPTETSEWLESFDAVLNGAGEERAQFIIERLQRHAHRRGVKLPFTANTPYVNTIPPERAAAVSRRPARSSAASRACMRWNAMAMVVQRQQHSHGHRRPHLDVCLVGDACTKSASTISFAAATATVPAT